MKKSADDIARIISRIFSPIIEAPLIIWLATSLNITFLSWLKVFLISLFFLFFLPYSFFLISLKIGSISDWDVTKRKERYGFNIIVLFSIIACLLVFYFLNEKALVYFYIRLLMPFFLYFLITFFWKISGHMLVNSIFILLLFFYASVPLQKPIVLFSGILLIIVGWSRIKLKKHTLAQVAAGALLPFTILI